MALRRTAPTDSGIITPPPKKVEVVSPALARQAYELITQPPPENPVWIGRTLLPRSGKCLFGGEAAIGKSMVALEMCRSLVLGEDLFGHPEFTIHGEPRVLYIEKEIGPFGIPDRLRKRFPSDAELAALWDRLFIITGHPGFRLDTEEGYREMDRELRAIRPNVVIIDPATKFMDGDDSDNHAVAMFFKAIDQLIADYRDDGLSFVIPHHFKKPPGQMPFASAPDPNDFNRFRGGSKWVDDPDTRVSLSKFAKGKDPTPHPGWTLRARFIFRHAPGFTDDLSLVVNENDNARVLWDPTNRQEKGFARPKERTFTRISD